MRKSLIFYMFRLAIELQEDLDGVAGGGWHVNC